MKIKFICDNELVAEHFPPLPAANMRPEWYKELSFYPNKHQQTAKEMLEINEHRASMTVKACMPVKDYIEQGYILRYPSDIAVTPENGPERKWWHAVSGNGVSAGSHPHYQMPVKLQEKEHEYFKVQQPWIVRTPPGYSCYFYQPEFFFDDKVRFLPGVVDTDTYDSPVNFPGVVTATESFTLKAGDPMMVVFPFKREAWTHEVGVEKQRPTAVHLFLEGGYRKLFRKKKSFR